METLARFFRRLRHGPLGALPAPVRDTARAAALASLQAVSLGRGRGVRVAGRYPLRVEWSRAAVDFTVWEAEFTREFGAALASRPVVFDVGASLGEWSALAATLAGPERVHVFEPDAPSWNRIRRIFALNRLAPPAGIVPAFCGAATRAEAAWWDGVARRRFPASADGDAAFQDLRRRPDLPVVALDDYAERTGAVPGVVKIDVEGAEGEVLRGARRLLATAGPRLFLSLHPQALPDFGDSRESILRDLADLGYRSRLLAVDHEEHWSCERPS